MVPFLRSTVSFTQAALGEDIIGQPVSRKEAVLEGITELAEDATLFLGPEDMMMIGGSGREGATVTRELGENIAERGVKLGPEVEPIGP